MSVVVIPSPYRNALTRDVLEPSCEFWSFRILRKDQNSQLAAEIAEPRHLPELVVRASTRRTGVHAAAIVKALVHGEALADRVYSLVPVSRFASGHDIRIGYMSGTSNVVHWLRRHSIEPSEALVTRILERARATNRVLRDDEVLAVVRAR